MTLIVPTITDPVGVDRAIQKLQIKLGLYLANLWGLTEYYSFGRAYRNPAPGDPNEDNGYIPEIYFSDNEYKDVFTIDTVEGMNFFYINDTVEKDEGEQYRATVNIVFFLNLDKVYPSKAHRATEDAEVDVMRYLERSPLGFEALRIIRGVDNVYRDFSYANRAKVDFQPYYIFMVETEVLYDSLSPDCIVSVPVPLYGTRAGSEIEVTGRINNYIEFSSPLPSADYGVTNAVKIWTNPGAGGDVGFTLVSKTKNGFTVNPARNGYLDYTVTLNQ